MPDYKIKRWDESNYDVNKNQYMKEAYEAKKYAFVTDFARFDILYQYGGIYLDTDVEIIRSLDDIVKKGPFMSLGRGSIRGFKRLNGCKKPFYAQSLIDPGSGIGSPAKFPIFKKVLDAYENRSFIKQDGSFDLTTVCWIFARNINFNKIEKIGNIACCDGLYVYPKDYFSPLSWVTHNLKITKNTRCIHWYDGTWLPSNKKKKNGFMIKRSIAKYNKFINSNDNK